MDRKMLIRAAPLIQVHEDNRRYVKLKEFGGNRNLIMGMDYLSAEYMAAALQKRELPGSPATEALNTCLQCLQGGVEKLVVYGLVDGQFKSQMTLKDQRDDRTYGVEVNVIDGIIIALVVGCPIFVVEEVFKQSNETAERVARDFFTAQAQMVFDHLDAKKERKM